VPIDQAFEFCNDRKLPLVETSALTGSNISFLFIKIAEMINDAATDRVQLERPVELTGGRHKKDDCC
jgi:hypothetical protein